jgi:hypothetical protein
MPRARQRLPPRWLVWSWPLDCHLAKWRLGNMPQRNDPETRTLEEGNIYFVYTPRVHSPGEEEKVGSAEDIERTYIILSAQKQPRYRRIVLGRKKLPDVHAGGQRFWGFVDIVGKQPEKVEHELEEVTYETATRGERVRPEARPAGEGVYRIVQHGNHNHLIYALELPKQPGPVQKELNIEPEASYIFSVKNPEASSPPGVGLGSRQKVHYPERLESKFRSRRFLPAEPELLDYEGVEVLLIGSSENPEEELGIQLQPQPENEWSADIFADLRMRRSQHPVEPLLSGEWR